MLNSSSEPATSRFGICASLAPVADLISPRRLLLWRLGVCEALRLKKDLNLLQRQPMIAQINRDLEFRKHPGSKKTRFAGEYLMVVDGNPYPAQTSSAKVQLSYLPPLGTRGESDGF